MRQGCSVPEEEACHHLHAVYLHEGVEGGVGGCGGGGQGEPGC